MASDQAPDFTLFDEVDVETGPLLAIAALNGSTDDTKSQAEEYLWIILL